MIQRTLLESRHGLIEVFTLDSRGVGVEVGEVVGAAVVWRGLAEADSELGAGVGAGVAPRVPIWPQTAPAMSPTTTATTTAAATSPAVDIAPESPRLVTSAA